MGTHLVMRKIQAFSRTALQLQRPDADGSGGAEESPSETEAIICALLRHKHSRHPTEGREYCKSLYESVKEARFRGSAKETDLFFFKTLGTSDLSSYFYGHVDHDLGSKWESWYKRTFSSLLKYLDEPDIFKMVQMAKAILNTVVYYLG